MDRRCSRIVYLLALLLLLSGGIVAQRFSAFDETDKMYRAFTDRIVIHLMNGVVFGRHLPRGNNGRLPDTSLVAYVLGGTQDSLSYKWRTVGLIFDRVSCK